jgi:hypothetical protein
MVESAHPAIETQRRIFIKYQYIPLAKPINGLKYGERQLDDIWRWVCQSQVYGHNGCKTHYIEKSKNPLYLKYGLGKAEYSSIDD